MQSSCSHWTTSFLCSWLFPTCMLVKLEYAKFHHNCQIKNGYQFSFLSLSLPLFFYRSLAFLLVNPQSARSAHVRGLQYFVCVSLSVCLSVCYNTPSFTSGLNCDTNKGWFDSCEPVRTIVQHMDPGLRWSLTWVWGGSTLPNCLKPLSSRGNKNHRVISHEFGVVRLFRTGSNHCTTHWSRPAVKLDMSLG